MDINRFSCAKSVSHLTVVQSIKVILKTVIFLWAIQFASAGELPIEGKWKVIDYICSHVSALTVEVAEEKYKKEFMISSKIISFNSSSVTNPRVALETYTEEEFWRVFMMGPEYFGTTIDDLKVYRISNSDGSDWDAPGSLIIQTEKNRIVTLWDGLYFVFERMEETQHN